MPGVPQNDRGCDSHRKAKPSTLSILLGSVQIGAGFILITLGTRWVPAAQVALLALTETVLAPTWVWLILDERPAPIALVGGLIVLFAVVSEGLAGLRRAKRRSSAP